MSKRLMKLQNRKVARAKARVKTSEPDVRTHEQIAAAREASKAANGGRAGMAGGSAMPASRNVSGPAVHSTAKSDA